MRTEFVEEVLTKLLAGGRIDRSDSLLAVCAGDAERHVFSRLGFQNVTISNLDVRLSPDAFSPYAYSFEDAHRLSFPDRSFDHTFVSDGLHHCSSPHRALLEMYRVCSKSTIVVESRDSVLMRSAERLGLTPEYELESVVGNDMVHGGVNNTEIPNYIYRWTERDFKKTIRSFDPTGEQDFDFFYALSLPYEAAAMSKSPLKLVAIRLLAPLVWLFTRLFKRQCNSFAMVATRPGIPQDVWPWLVPSEDGFRFNRSFAESRYKPYRKKGGGKRD